MDGPDHIWQMYSQGNNHTHINTHPQKLIHTHTFKHTSTHKHTHTHTHTQTHTHTSQPSGWTKTVCHIHTPTQFLYLSIQSLNHNAGGQCRFSFFMLQQLVDMEMGSRLSSNTYPVVLCTGKSPILRLINHFEFRNWLTTEISDMETVS